MATTSTSSTGFANRAELEAEIRSVEAKLPAAVRPAPLTGWHGMSALRKRLADARANFASLSTATACDGGNQSKTLAAMEAQWEECKGKAKANGVKTPAIHCAAQLTGVTNSATPPPLPGSKERLLENRVAELEKALANAKAAPSEPVAKRIIETAARAAVAELSADRRASTASHLDTFNGLSGAQATAYFKEHGKAIRAEQLDKVVQAQKKS